MSKGTATPPKSSEDWKCCEQCSYCLVIFVSILFFLAGTAMVVLSALIIWGDIDAIQDVTGLDFFSPFNSLVLAIFIVGLCIAVAALIGMVFAGCAKCAANPDGKCDDQEKCLTGCLAFFYITILMVVLLASLVIAGFLTYYAVNQLDSADGVGGAQCPYPDDSTKLFIASNATVDNSPDAFTCPIDSFFYEMLYPTSGEIEPSAALVWSDLQNHSLTCGYYCNNNDDIQYCSPNLDGGIFSQQTTGYFCTNEVNVPQNPSTKYIGYRLDLTEQAYATGEVSTMPYRPTFFSVFATYLIPLLAVWWCLFVFALLLVIASFAMCCRKQDTKKKSAKYKPPAGN